MAFSPKTEYTIIEDIIRIKDFHDYATDYVTRPPYQRKAVWSTQKKQALMDSLLRSYYIPRLVLRKVRISDNRALQEVIDGQQRITTVIDFFQNKFALPKSLEDLDTNLVGKKYNEISNEHKRFIDTLSFKTDVIINIEEANNVNHQLIATEIFRRLQEGENLNYMEIAHAQLSSLSRNFIVKYSDDQTFNFIDYQPLDQNPSKLRFFDLLNVNNSRMKHLQFMARFTMIESSVSGYTDLGDKKIEQFINDTKVKDGIGNFSFEEMKESKDVIRNLNEFYEIFKNDPMLDENSGIKELSVEYFIISIYLLIRHLKKHYVIEHKEREFIRNFVYYFHERWRNYDDSEDVDMLTFSNNRQQGENELATRDRIIRQVFFSYIHQNKSELIEKDSKRAFSELERIEIYRKAHGLCQECLQEGKSKKEAEISWSNYQADHVIPHTKGGKTVLENSQLLCRFHNLRKSDKL
ncbi:DUF262 domain-containing protein [Psychrobacter sp. 16-MNA-CIBAN-0192]|uniref:GmrSD restriction endonuclease domain-containing protein n=1 Tax=Psychrobacter sp. 16-MNA-CIBAN-0192 TaxID=3140448 RepID=UPI00332F028D